MSEKYYNNLDDFENWNDHYKVVCALIRGNDALVKKAIAIVKKYHDQKRFFYKGVYNRHPLRVARILLEEFDVYDTDAILIALCHDLGEWSEYDIEDLRTEFNDSVYEGVQVLTRNKNDSWTRFVEKIIETDNQDLIKIKIADKLDNNRGLVFSDDVAKKAEAKEKTILVMEPVITKYYSESWVKFEEILSKL